nr:PREDICTED: tetratricopeptide repeat protein 16 isoform X2 [Latimeria chalumnae]|eukprot:XP_014341677.1 PREDICTED: tetratricopeptide repeat protein 16 isoform X2 [Latimeria chalumnae]
MEESEEDGSKKGEELLQSSEAGCDVQVCETFPTAVSDEQIQEAKEKAKKRLFGSSQLFVQDKMDVAKQPLSYHVIVESKAGEHALKGADHFSQGEWQKAIICLTKAINLSPQQGQFLFDQEMYTEALERFTHLLELKPDYVSCHMRSIVCLDALGRHGECLQLVNEWLEKERTNPELFVLQARLHEMFHEITACQEDLRSALLLDPKNTEALSLVSRLEKRAKDAKAQAVDKTLNGKLQGAVGRINIAIENDPSKLEYYVFRGTLHRRLKDFNAAIDDLVLAMDRSNNSCENEVFAEAQRQLLLTYNDFAVLCYTKGFYSEAIQLLTKALIGEKKEQGLYVNRGDCFFKMGELEFALADYQQALELELQDWRIWSRIAAVQNVSGLQDYKERRYQQAEEKFSRAIQSNPLVPQYYLNRAKARQLLQEEVESQCDAVTTLLLDPKNEEIISHLTHIFPGKTVADIMSSKIVEVAKAMLDISLQNCAPFKTQAAAHSLSWKTTKSLPPDEQEQGAPAAKPEETEADTQEKEVQETGSDITPCVSESELYTEIIDCKMKVDKEIKKAFQDRKSLKSDRPKLNALKPPTEAPSKPYHWKQAKFPVEF